MVGLVLVSHSPDLVSGLRDLLTQMEPDVAIGIAGGTDDGELGTSLELIDAALDAADTGDGVVVLYDLGSAQMTAETALEFLDDDRRQRSLLVDAPLVEGALAAAGAAGGGGDVATVATAARSVFSSADAPPDDTTAGDTSRPDGAASDSSDGTTQPDDGSESGAPTDPSRTDGGDAGPAADPERSVTLTIRNRHGLHARPAAQLVRTVRPLDATVRISRTDGTHGANAASTLAVLGLNAQAGTQVTVSADGPQWREALDAVRDLIDTGFGEPDDVEAADQ